MYIPESTTAKNQPVSLKRHLALAEHLPDKAANQSNYFDSSYVQFIIKSVHSGDIVKRAMDIGLAGAALLIFLPVLLLIAVAIRLDTKGPVLYRSLRRGRHGSTINIFKFRSMYHDPQAGFEQATKNDPRVTPVGRFIRHTSLDELPQLLNVLAGTLSLVGPRPHPIALDAKFAELIPSYKSRYKFKPGITGLAQICGFRGETRDLYDMFKRVEHDLRYIENWTLRLDLKILITTAIKGWVHKNAY